MFRWELFISLLIFSNSFSFFYSQRNEWSFSWPLLNLDHLRLKYGYELRQRSFTVSLFQNPTTLVWSMNFSARFRFTFFRSFLRAGERRFDDWFNFFRVCFYFFQGLPPILKAPQKELREKTWGNHRKWKGFLTKQLVSMA